MERHSRNARALEIFQGLYFCHAIGNIEPTALPFATRTPELWIITKRTLANRFNSKGRRKRDGFKVSVPLKRSTPNGLELRPSLEHERRQRGALVKGLGAYLLDRGRYRQRAREIGVGIEGAFANHLQGARKGHARDVVAPARHLLVPPGRALMDNLLRRLVGRQGGGDRHRLLVLHHDTAQGSGRHLHQ